MNGDRAPVNTWTDDEWLESMVEFPPDTDIATCERWIMARRTRKLEQLLTGQEP